MRKAALLAAALLALSSSNAFAALKYRSNYANGGFGQSIGSGGIWNFLQCGSVNYAGQQCPYGCQNAAYHQGGNGLRCPTSAMPSTVSVSSCPNGNCHASVWPNLDLGDTYGPRGWARFLVPNDDHYNSGTRQELVGPDVCGYQTGYGRDNVCLPSAEGSEEWFRWDTHVTVWPKVVPQPSQRWAIWFQFHTNWPCSFTDRYGYPSGGRNPFNVGAVPYAVQDASGATRWEWRVGAYGFTRVNDPSDDADISFTDTAPIRDNTTYRFVLKVKWSQNWSGEYRLWMDDGKGFRLLGDVSNIPTIHTWGSCRPSEGDPVTSDSQPVSYHFKMGFYHDDERNPGTDHDCWMINGIGTTIYHSDLQIASACTDISPTPAGVCCSTAKSCADYGATCGTPSDGCGGSLFCGTCTAPQTCGGGGAAWQCGGEGACVPKTCVDYNANCGTPSDGCDGMLNCGTCSGTETCGGGGVQWRCGTGCTPKTCTADYSGADCGEPEDGCGNTLFCGACTAPQTCGGAGVEYHCGCTPKTCADYSAACGSPSDACGGSLSCGTCTEPQTCGGGGVNWQCGCTPETNREFCRRLGKDCGSGISGTDNCGTGRTVDCGLCNSTFVCTAENTCVSDGTYVCTLKDTFGDSSFDTALWTRTASGGAVSESTTLRLAAWASTGTTQLLASSKEPRAMTGCKAEVKVDEVVSPDGYIDQQFFIRRDDNNYGGWLYQGGKLHAFYKVNGTEFDVASLTYSATSHRWWKIRETLGMIFWETSPDGNVWTTQGSVPTSAFFTLDSIYVRFYVETWGSGLATPGKARFSRFNTGP